MMAFEEEVKKNDSRSRRLVWVLVEREFCVISPELSSGQVKRQWRLARVCADKKEPTRASEVFVPA